MVKYRQLYHNTKNKIVNEKKKYILKYFQKNSRKKSFGEEYYKKREVIQMELKTVRMEFPEDTNIIIGQTHFIKTAEDLYEVMVNSVPNAKFGLAFNEASGPCLVRAEGNDSELKAIAIKNVKDIGAGHVFVIVLKDAFPINVLNAIKNCPEICSIFCATANPVEVIIAQTDLGRGVLGVIDGNLPKGVEKDKDVQERKEFLRMIGYKL